MGIAIPKERGEFVQASPQEMDNFFEFKKSYFEKVSVVLYLSIIIWIYDIKLSAACTRGVARKY